jgi:hypothetical protein
MASTYGEIASLFRDAAREMRNLADRKVKESGRVLDLYEHRGDLKTADAFPPDRCLELANALEELAQSLEAVPSLPLRHN